MVEILKQPQYRPVPVERQVVAIWVGTGGYLDDLPVEDAKRFVDEFIEHARRPAPSVLDAIRDTGELSDETEATLKQAVDDFAQVVRADRTAEPGARPAAGQGAARRPRSARTSAGTALSSHDDEDEAPGSDG